ncbi:MAG TPA: STM3941 family protein [Flavisolibacter sp.]|nr:STM3941 family protein [Flavisolibacter sp.]
MIEYKIHKSPWMGIKQTLVCSVFVLLGISILNQPDSPKVLAWLAILLFGLALLVSFIQLLDRRPPIIINESGVIYRTTRKRFINWEIIQDAYVAEIHSHKFICLLVDPQFELPASKDKWTKKLARLSKALGFQKLNIPLVNVKVDAERLNSLILAMRTADRSTKVTILKEAAPDMI